MKTGTVFPIPERTVGLWFGAMGVSGKGWVAVVSTKWKFVGIGVSVAIYSLLVAYMLRPLFAWFLAAATQMVLLGQGPTAALFAMFAQILAGPPAPLAIVFGGVVLSILAGWYGAQYCGIKTGEKLAWHTPLRNFIIGLLVPLLFVWIVAPAFGFLNYWASWAFIDLDALVASMEALGISSVQAAAILGLLFAIHVAAAFILILLAAMPASAISALIVTLLSYRSIRRQVALKEARPVSERGWLTQLKEESRGRSEPS